MDCLKHNDENRMFKDDVKYLFGLCFRYMAKVKMMVMHHFEQKQSTNTSNFVIYSYELILNG